MQIDYQGYVDGRGKPHVGPYIASGKRGRKAMFLPGANLIPADLWQDIKDSQGVQQRLKSGQLRILVDDSEDPSADDVHGVNLADMDQASAIQLIVRTIEPDLLEAWHDQEQGGPKRAPVLEALASQLGAVEPDKRKRGKPVLRDHAMPEGVEDAPADDGSVRRKRGR